MFTGRRRNSLRQAIEEAGDSELKALKAEVAERQERIAALELELFDTRASVARFERELETRVRPLERKLRKLQKELREAMHRAERTAQWGERIHEEGIPDVVEDFRKAWTPREPTRSAPEEEAPREPEAENLKHLFRQLAKRFHPDLVIDPARKRWRQQMMAKVNEAYAAKDLSALQALARQSEEPEPEQPRSRQQILIELAAESRRLDGIIITLEHELERLMRSELIQLQLEASIARREGRDLLGEMVSALQLQIAEVEADLGALA